MPSYAYGPNSKVGNCTFGAHPSVEFLNSCFGMCICLSAIICHYDSNLFQDDAFTCGLLQIRKDFDGENKKLILFIVHKNIINFFTYRTNEIFTAFKWMSTHWLDNSYQLEAKIKQDAVPTVQSYRIFIIGINSALILFYGYFSKEFSGGKLMCSEQKEEKLIRSEFEMRTCSINITFTVDVCLNFTFMYLNLLLSRFLLFDYYVTWWVTQVTYFYGLASDICPPCNIFF